MPDVLDIAEFTNDEIRREFEERFGKDDPDISEFSTHDLIEELENRDRMPETSINGLDEIADLIAEAARTSRHAAKVYGLLRETFTELDALSVRQCAIAGRMRDAA